MIPTNELVGRPRRGILRAMARPYLRTLLAILPLATTGCGDERPAGLGGSFGGLSDAAPVVRDTGPRPDTAFAEDAADPADATLVIADGYPAGPYGKTKGATFPPLTLAGYRDGSPTWSTVSMKDYFDPDGTKGIRGVLVVAAAEWCGVCQGEVKWVTASYASAYRAKGARFVTALLQNGARSAATQATATLWRDTFSIPYAVAIDPSLSTLPESGGALTLPYSYVLDPRTMRVVEVTSAAQTPPTIPALDAVIAKN